MTISLNKVTIADINQLAAPIPLPLITNPPKERLVARWLVDENSNCYCQWIVETEP